MKRGTSSIDAIHINIEITLRNVNIWFSFRYNLDIILGWKSMDVSLLFLLTDNETYRVY